MRQQAEAEALYQAAIESLPEPFRADGPRLAFEFDDPPGPKKGRKTPASSRPASAKPAPKRKRSLPLPQSTLLASGLAEEAAQDSAGEPHDAEAISEGPNGVARSEMEEEDWGNEAEGDGTGEGEVQPSKKAKGGGTSRSKKAAAEMARLAAMDPERRREEEIKKALRESEKATQLQKRLENTMRKVHPPHAQSCARTLFVQTLGHACRIPWTNL